MPEDVSTPACWPDRFVYLCTAGGGANVNIAPMLHAGRDRVAAVMILVPMTRPDHPSPIDIAQAKLPADRLESYACRVLGLPGDRVRRLTGHPDLLGDWTGAIREAAEWARALDAEIVFNITGGRKPATLGAMLGQVGADEIPVSLITVGVSPVEMRLVQISANGSLEERSLPAPARAALDDYLASYGIQEINRDKRLSWTCWMEAQAHAVDTIKRLSWKQRQTAFPTMYRLLAIADRKPLPIHIPLDTSARDILIRVVAGLDGADIDGDHLRVDTDEAKRFLAGQWLEALILREVSSQFVEQPEVQVFSSVEISDNGATHGRNMAVAETEFDLVVLGDDRLDLVQAKAGVSPKGLHDAITKLGAYRTRLAGPAGAAWLVVPLMTQRRLDERDILKHALAEGVTVLCNDQAVRNLVADLARRYPRRS